MKTIVILGAGPAGLTAALEILKRSDYRVVVLEKRGDIGGISRTVHFAGNRMDIGGHRFFSKDQRVMNWWNDIMPLQGAPAMDDKRLNRAVDLAPGGPDPDATDRVMLVRNRVSRIYYQGHFFDYPVRLSRSTLRAMGFCTTMAVGFSYLKSALHPLPEASLEDFYINSFGKKLYAMFFEGYTEKLWGRHPREIDASWGAQRTKGLSIRGVVRDVLDRAFLSADARAKRVQTSLIEAFRYPKFGPGQLWEAVAEEICRRGGEILRNCDVQRVETQGGRVQAVRYLRGGEEIRQAGDAFFSSIPLKDFIAGMDGVPEEVSSIAQGLPYRDFVTVGLLVSKLKIQNETCRKTLGGIVPDCWIYVQDTGVKLGRIQIFNNWSPYLLEDPEHTVWLGLEYFCTQGDDFWHMPEAQCVDFATAELRKIGVLAQDAQVLASHRERVEKAYPAYFDTYAHIDRVIDYLNQFDNLYCLGRNGQHRYNNMDHAMATSFAAVDALLCGGADHRAVWRVNTEATYNETR